MPDFYNGTLAAECDKVVRQLLGSSIIPSTQDHLPIAPNFFCGGKGPDGSHAMGDRQVLENRALGARTMHNLQRFGNAAMYDNNVYAITSLYHCGHLELFTVYPLEPASRLPPKQRHALSNDAIEVLLAEGYVETFRHGVQAFRNARDWAKEQRDSFISKTNATAATMPGVFCPDRSGELQFSTVERGYSGSAPKPCNPRI
ncbi:hypothetical protein BJX62DRAFT_237700 [Aspergillus germanicus]